MKSLLTAQGLRKSFFRAGRSSARSFDAVADVSLTLAPGELVALMGRSGSGKSTLLNMLGGLLAPDAGIVSLDGRDLYALGDAERSRVRNATIGMVPQGHTALHSLTALENVLLPRTLYGDGAQAEAEALELLGRLGMADLAGAYPAELSGGELRRVAIARALVMRPSLILADEPTSDLDDENTALVMGVFKAEAEAGRAVMIVSHEQACAAYASRVLRMDAGHLVEA